jgi:hypothetical protein
MNRTRQAGPWVNVRIYTDNGQLPLEQQRPSPLIAKRETTPRMSARPPISRICLACSPAPYQNRSVKPFRNTCRLPAFCLGRHRQILNHAARLASLILAVSVAASVCLFWRCDTRAQSEDDLPTPQEPQLAEPGDWAADFNDAQIACYEGQMSACDSIWKSDRVLFDTFLYEYGRSCGGRVDRRQISRAGLDCTEAFPGH